MQHHPRRAAVAAGLLLTAAVGATIPASAATQTGTTTQTPATALVVNARWGGHCTFDRLVIDVRGSMPKVTVAPVRELRYDASGERVPLPGKHFLQIRLSPAAAHNAAGQSVYRGPRLVKIRLPQLRGLALTGDFEGVVGFGAAFHTKPDYHTFKLHSPERFVLDVRHANSCA
ncbi:AMIN-like domain-containing (lipo)protein [Streptomyces sp. NPDC002671]